MSCAVVAVCSRVAEGRSESVVSAVEVAGFPTETLLARKRRTNFHDGLVREIIRMMMARI
jgi:hypothetical protein